MQGSYEVKYKNDASGLEGTPGQFSGRIKWECPSNIALVKYWGKKPVQKPLNPSVSFGLQQSKTVLSVDYSIDRSRNQLSLHYLYEEKPNRPFEQRLFLYLKELTGYLPFLDQMEIVINAYNTFPHSAGIASSASTFGAMALCLCTIEQNMYGTLQNNDEFIMKASFLARMGSGSACRSVNGGFSLWGITDAFEHSDDEMAVSLNNIVHPVFRDYCNSILIINSEAKLVSSSTGHQLMEHHPFSASRIIQANENVKKMLGVLKSGDESGFALLVEEEALSLHAMMLASKPGYLLMKPATWEVISRIRKFRNNAGHPVCFSLDAGANVHLLYPSRAQKEVSSFIISELKGYCEHGRVIHDTVGTGPRKLI